MAIGDWNNTPEEFIQSKWAKRLDAYPIAPEEGQPTCTSGRGRVLDYVVCPKEARVLIKAVRPRYDVPWSPHVGVELTLHQHPRALQVLQPVGVASFVVPDETIQIPKGLKRAQHDRCMAARLEDKALPQELDSNDDLTKKIAMLRSETHFPVLRA